MNTYVHALPVQPVMVFGPGSGGSACVGAYCGRSVGTSTGHVHAVLWGEDFCSWIGMIGEVLFLAT